MYPCNNPIDAEIFFRVRKILEVLVIQEKSSHPQSDLGLFAGAGGKYLCSLLPAVNLIIV